MSWYTLVTRHIKTPLRIYLGRENELNGLVWVYSVKLPEDGERREDSEGVANLGGKGVQLYDAQRSVLCWAIGVRSHQAIVCWFMMASRLRIANAAQHLDSKRLSAPIGAGGNLKRRAHADERDPENALHSDNNSRTPLQGHRVSTLQQAVY